jgi:glycosyltransferase involved in cell wall biosynthesis
MIVKNESRYLHRCLQSVVDLVDEMIIVDTGSIDNTKQIGFSYGAKVYDFQWTNNFSEARNFALKRSESNWNIVLDADEYIDQRSIKEILKFIQGDYRIGRIIRKDKFYQDGELKTSHSLISRILPKGASYVGRIHEQVSSKYPKENTSIAVHHDGYLLKSDRAERNLKLLELELSENPKNDYILYQIAKEYRLAKQYNKANAYYEQCYSLVPPSSLYKPNFIVDYLYNIISIGNLEIGLKVISKERSKLNDYPDFHFVSALLYMELIFKNSVMYGHLLPMIEKEYLACIKLSHSDRYDSVIGTGTYLAAYNLGVFYETTGNMEKAKVYYQKSAEYQYERAIQRLSKFN